jgi:photosystem II stability/assembly factor-like uncharacterized protein
MNTQSILDDLQRLDPAPVDELRGTAHSESMTRVLARILSAARDRPSIGHHGGQPWRGQWRPLGQRRLVVAAVAAAVVALVVGLLVGVGNEPGTTSRATTPWQLGQAFHGSGHERTGQWQLVDDVLSGTWQQYTSGPPGGGVCPTASACYVMAGHWSSASATTPDSESFYASTDVGATWTMFPMPSGFVGTTQLSCGAATVCAAGGTYQGTAVLVSTTDGGHSFTISPLPKGVGTLYALSCPTAGYCGGLVATRTWGGVPADIPIDATFLSTSDGGKTFAQAPIFTDASMHQLVCSSADSCIVTGQRDGPTYHRLGPTTGQSLAAVTTDGGRTWTPGTLPNGLELYYNAPLACPDAAHCYTAGRAPDSAAKPQTTIQVVATTVNGGLTWTEEPAPANVPHLGIVSMSCPTDSECWVAGTYQGKSNGGDSPVLLGTTNGGVTWSRVTFSVPDGASNYDGQSYLSMGEISCPTVDTCVAWGAIAEGSPSAPVYSLRS